MGVNNGGFLGWIGEQRSWLWGGFFGLVLVGTSITALTMATRSHHRVQANGVEIPDEDEDEDPQDTPSSVQVIKPKLTRSFTRSVKEPCYIAPYYKADLFARVSGTVSYIQKNIGESVYRGECLVEIDVPDLVQDVALKEAMVKQAQDDVEAARQEIVTRRERVATAESIIKEKQADIKAALALTEQLELLVARSRNMVKTTTLQPELLEERIKTLRVAEATYQSTLAGVERAQSEERVAQALVGQAAADLKVKQAQLRVIHEQCKQAKTLVDFAKVRADFDGVITARNVDPSAFVHNATTSVYRTPLLAIQRIDLVTVVMMVPDKSAPYIKPDTEAIIEFDALPGQVVRSRITRFSPALDAKKGRTMRVEVDLYNPGEANYQRALARGVATFLAPLAATQACEAVALAGASKAQLSRRGLFKPDMFGRMRLMMENFTQVYLVPISCVFSDASEGGQTYLYLVREGQVQRVPVRVQLEDGVQAKVQLITYVKNPSTGEEEETLHEMTGKEEIILSGQGELLPGQKVQPIPVKW